MSHDPNEMMLELFRAEVESHSESLTSSLLRLEQDPTDTVLLDGMMRAAHSIKGAARIVRVDAAVDIAHVMEDCFVAAQRSELVLQPAGIDILLRAVDLLGQISEASKNPNVDWNSFQPSIQSTVSHLRSVLQGHPMKANESRSVPIPAPQPTHAPAPPIESQHSVQEAIELSHASRPAVPLPDAASRSQRIAMPEKLNASNAEAIRLQLLAALEALPSHGQVVLDLSLTQDLDPIGLALMHSVTRFAASKNQSLQFEHVASKLARIFQIVGIGSVGQRSNGGNEGIQDA